MEKEERSLEKEYTEFETKSLTCFDFLDKRERKDPAQERETYPVQIAER